MESSFTNQRVALLKKIMIMSIQNRRRPHYLRYKAKFPPWDTTPYSERRLCLDMSAMPD